MFAGLETAHTHPVRRWTALVSFTLQAMLLATALIVPLLRPASLPDASSFRRIFLPMPEGSPQPRVNPNANSAPSTSAPLLPPILVRTGPATQTTTQDGPNTGPVTGPPNINFGDSNSGIPSIMADTHYQALPKPPVVVHRTRPTSVMMEGNLLRRVDPHYPPIAVQLGIQGTVVIKAIISRDGAVEHPEVVSGQPFLASAAMEAVREWRYRPYYLNGQPVEVETQITVNFVLNR